MAQPDRANATKRANRLLVMAGLGLVIALVAGSASISRLSRHPDPPAPALPVLEAPARPPAGERASVDDVARGEIERRRAMLARLQARIEAGRFEIPQGDEGGLLDDAEPVPIHRDGVLTGIELRDVEPEGFYARLGLRDGDRIQSLNGIRFDTPGFAGALVPSLLQSDRLEVEVERADGRSHPIFVPRDRVFEWLEAMEGPAAAL